VAGLLEALQRACTRGHRSRCTCVDVAVEVRVWVGVCDELSVDVGVFVPVVGAVAERVTLGVAVEVDVSVGDVVMVCVDVTVAADERVAVGDADGPTT